MYSTDVLPLFLPASQDELDAGITLLLHRMDAWLPVFIGARSHYSYHPNSYEISHCHRR